MSPVQVHCPEAALALIPGPVQRALGQWRSLQASAGSPESSSHVHGHTPADQAWCWGRRPRVMGPADHQDLGGVSRRQGGGLSDVGCRLHTLPSIQEGRHDGGRYSGRAQAAGGSFHTPDQAAKIRILHPPNGLRVQNAGGKAPRRWSGADCARTAQTRQSVLFRPHLHVSLPAEAGARVGPLARCGQKDAGMGGQRRKDVPT